MGRNSPIQIKEKQQRRKQRNLILRRNNMKKLKNIILKDEAGANIYTDAKSEEPACTVTIIKTVLNNPIDSITDGKVNQHSYTPEEMAVAVKVVEKIKSAVSASKAGAEGVLEFELEDAEFKLVKTYPPLYTGLNWAPFVTQIFEK